MTAPDERRARSAAVILLSLVRNSPPEVTKTTPLMIVGGSGETRSREAQAGCNVSAPFRSTTFQATTAPFVTALLNPRSAACEPTVGASIQRAPLASCQLASAPGAGVPAFDEAGVVKSAVFPSPPRLALSSKCARPSLVVAAIRIFPLCSKTTGEDENS